MATRAIPPVRQGNETNTRQRGMAGKSGTFSRKNRATIGGLTSGPNKSGMTTRRMPASNPVR